MKGKGRVSHVHLKVKTVRFVKSPFHHHPRKETFLGILLFEKVWWGLVIDVRCSDFHKSAQRPHHGVGGEYFSILQDELLRVVKRRSPLAARYYKRRFRMGRISIPQDCYRVVRGPHLVARDRPR